MLSCVFSFTTLSLPAYSLASLSTEGDMARQGPHHSAQKSTRTGVGLCRTADSQVLSVTSRALLMGRWLRVRAGEKGAQYGPSPRGRPPPWVRKPRKSAPIREPGALPRD